MSTCDSRIRHLVFACRANRWLVLSASTVILVSFSAGRGSAAPGDLLFTLRSPAPTNREQFGAAVVRYVDELLIGAPHDQGTPPNPGTVFRYDALTGAYLGAIANPEPDDYDGFGKTLALLGEELLVTAWFDDAIYRTSLGGSDPLRRIDNPYPTTAFGTSLLWLGDRYAVGSIFNERDGRVLVFDATTDSVIHNFTDPMPHSEFGRHLGTWNNHLLVGAQSWQDASPNRGNIRMYDLATGAAVRDFRNPVEGTLNTFGEDFTVTGDRLYVGASGDHHHGFTNAGSVYEYDLNTGQFLRAIVSPIPQDEVFGSTVTIWNGLLAVGAPNARGPGGEFGAVYLFELSTGRWLQTLRSPSTEPSNFGYGPIDVASDRIVVSATLDLPGGEYPGDVHVFEGLPTIPPPPSIALIAHTDFDEPNVGAANYSPNVNGREIGFSTSATQLADVRAILGVTGGPVVKHFAHASYDAVTTFDFVDLTGWRDVEISLLFNAFPGGYEVGDFARLSITNGQQTIDLISLTATASGQDPLDIISRAGYQQISAQVPSDWTQVSLVFATRGNSSSGAERYELDTIRISGQTIVPEPSTMLLVIAGSSLAVPMITAGRRRKRMAF